MKGCRALLPEEILAVDQKLTCLRDKVLFKTLLATGFRISEALSLKVNSVFLTKTNTSRIKLERRNTKGKCSGRTIDINQTTANAIQELIDKESLTNSDFLFFSRKGDKALGRKQGWQILKSGFDAANVRGAVSCHSTRKTLAYNIFQLSGKNIVLTQKALGHESVSSTISYLSVDEGEVSSLMTSIDVFKVA